MVNTSFDIQNIWIILLIVISSFVLLYCFSKCIDGIRQNRMQKKIQQKCYFDSFTQTDLYNVNQQYYYCLDDGRYYVI